MTVWQGLRVGAMVAAMAAPLFAQGNPARGGGPAQGRGSAGPGLALTTTAFDDGGIIPNEFTQAESDYKSPALSWTNVPNGTVSFALIVHDADVAPGRNPEDFLHWLVFNIPGNARGIAEGLAPTATGDIVQGRNGRNTPGWLGPGAAAGPYHHYVFELFALDTRLSVPATATRAQVMEAMAGHVVGKAALTGRFHR
jgi:Raf kinase inhibitor-like YbhB/YbcL family protein